MRWLEQCREWVRKYDPVKPEMLSGEFHHYGFMRRLSELLPANAIVVSDTGGNVIMMGHCFQSKAGQRIFSSNGNTPMGFALAGAIGAWFADPSRPVYCIIGDGGMQLNIQELQTIKHYGVPVKVIILNNHILGNTKSYQRVNKKAELACGPDGYSCPDFVAVAKAYGIEAVTIDKLWGSRSSYAQGTLEEMLPKVIAHPGPIVVDVVHHDFCAYEPRLSRWDAGIEEMHPPLPEEEFLANMIVQPLEGWEKRR
jgi:acetolactate synthase-1/2/3 large subunit